MVGAVPGHGDVAMERHKLNAAAILAFSAVYLIWGTTYLAIRYAVEVIPPFLLVGTRCLIAGAVLYAWARLRGDTRPSLDAWKKAAVVGALLFVGGQGLVTVAEKTVDSGIAALIVATVPAWFILLQIRQVRPSPRTVAGVSLGLVGVTLLLAPTSGGAAVDLMGGFLLVLAALTWAIGSLISRSGWKAEPGKKTSDAMGTGVTLIAGGTLTFLLGSSTGELGQLASAELSARPILAFVYLTIFGSLAAFSAYTWLLRRFPPAAAGSYTFVNPAVAVVVGWAIGGETLTAATMTATAVIVAGVYLVVTAKPVEAKQTAASETVEPCPEPPCEARATS